jgi:hypothetical protein
MHMLWGQTSCGWQKLVQEMQAQKHKKQTENTIAQVKSRNVHVERL